jgi:hypothetical protein
MDMGKNEWQERKFLISCWERDSYQGSVTSYSNLYNECIPDS